MSIRVWLGDGMADPESDIELKIDFVEDEGSPARVFEIAAQIIRAFEDLDRALVSSVDSTISTTMVLEDVEKSSLKVFLRNVLKQVDDQALKDLDWKPLVGQYLVKAKRVAVEWLDRKIGEDQPAGIEDLTERLQKLAAETDVRHIPDYPKLNPARIAQPLDELQRAKAKFRSDEGLVITLGKEDYRVDLSSTWMPSEHMSEVKGDKILSNTSDMVLIIKNTSLASVVGFVELARSGQIINNSLFEPFLIYAIIALIYFALCFPISLLSRRLERRLGVGRAKLMPA